MTQISNYAAAKGVEIKRTDRGCSKTLMKFPGCMFLWSAPRPDPEQNLRGGAKFPGGVALF